MRRLLCNTRLWLWTECWLILDDHMSSGETANFSGCNRKGERGQQENSIFYCICEVEGFFSESGIEFLSYSMNTRSDWPEFFISAIIVNSERS